jgi:hypothetical protein
VSEFSTAATVHIPIPDYLIKTYYYNKKTVIVHKKSNREINAFSKRLIVFDIDTCTG